MFNDKDDFQSLREQREKEEKKEQKTRELNKRLLQDKSFYKKIVEEVLEELKNAIYPSAEISGPEEVYVDWGEKYNEVLEILSYNPKSVPWNRYLRKIEYLTGLGNRTYLKWEFKSKTDFLFIHVGLINFETIGFIIDNFYNEAMYAEFSRENLVQELTRFYSPSNSHRQESLPASDRILSDQTEVSVKLTIANWKAISKILRMYCQHKGQGWIEWGNQINTHIQIAMKERLNTNINKIKKPLSLEEADAINDEIVRREAMDTYDELSEYFDDD